MRIAVVEDAAAAQNQLETYINRFAEETGEPVSVTVYNDGYEICSKYNAQYDLILLDIQMKQMDGMQAAELIRAQDKEVLIVFVTGLEQYAVQGYSVSAMDFVVKPLNYLVIKKVLQRARERISSRGKNCISFMVKQKLVRVSTDDIRYIEAQRHGLRVHTVEAEYLIYDTMQNMEEKLRPFGFFRCHNGYLINLKYVTQVNRNTVTVGDEQLLVSRAKQKALLEQLTSYLN